MIPGDGWDLSFTVICFRVEENPDKISARKTDPTGDMGDSPGELS